MSVVVIGGNERMTVVYKDICKEFHCRAKIFTKMSADFENQLGTPDLMVVFTNTVSHKMVHSVNSKSQKHNIPVARVHNASANTLRNVLINFCKQVSLN